MEKPKNIFKTTDADLASFLIMEGVKVHDFIIEEGSRNIVTIEFNDERQNCLDLERLFLGHVFSEFRRINKYVLKKIHETLRSNNGARY